MCLWLKLLMLRDNEIKVFYPWPIPSVRQNKRFLTVFCCVFNVYLPMFVGESVHGIPQLNMSVPCKPKCTILRITSFVIKTPPRERKLVRKSVFFESHWQKNFLLLALLFAIPFFSYERFFQSIYVVEKEDHKLPKLNYEQVIDWTKVQVCLVGEGFISPSPILPHSPSELRTYFTLGSLFILWK